MPHHPQLSLVATCAIGLDRLVAEELRALGLEVDDARTGAVSFRGSWRDVMRVNWRVRTANRVLVELATWNGHDGDALYAGARNLVRGTKKRGGLDIGRLLSPEKTLAIRATTTASKVTDSRWVALRVKDGLVDGQRDRHGRRASVDKDDPDLPLRLRLFKNQATLLLDTTGTSLDHRGYRVESTRAPARETLAAGLVLASGWDGSGPVADPMCGSGTLLVEAAWWARGVPPAALRHRDTPFAFERLPLHGLGVDPETFAAVRDETIPAPNPDGRIWGVDRDREAVAAARTNLERAGLDDAIVKRADAFSAEPPAGPGLVVVNPPYGERLAGGGESLERRLFEHLREHYAGWRAALLLGGDDPGAGLGANPARTISVKNGPLDARIVIFDRL